MHKPVCGFCWFLISACLIAVSAGAQSVSPELYNGLNWRLIGPFRGGRAVAASGIPGNPATFYFGAVDGGIWRTTDGGVVWKPIFDDQHVASIGALAVASSDPKVIYAGTGESDIRSDLSSGDGVYKSSDGGQTWTNVGLRDSRQISRIVVDPGDANIVYVAALGHAYAPNTERGVYKSIDGGSNWTKILDLGPEIGAADLAIATDNPSVLFATAWHAHRPPWATYGPITEPGGGLYRSTDGGRSWSHLTGNGLPGGDWARSGVAVSANGKRVYALIDVKDAGLYRSNDGGDTWTLVNSDKRITNRSWYFGSVTVDPQNPDVLYIPNTAFYRSEDGGKSISIVRAAPGGDDYHQVWIDPKDSSRMILATDQGTTISVNYGKTWSSWYNQPTAQLYHVITDDKFPYAVYGTQQDSGAIAVYSRTDHGRITAQDWFSPGGSESGYIALDPKNPNIFFVSSTYGGVSRFDQRTGFSQDVTPWPVPNWTSEIIDRKYRDPWTPVLLFSPIDKQTLYLGTQFVMKTTDGGLHWQAISPDLTGSARKPGDKKPEGPPTVGNAKQRGYGVVYTIAPSSLKQDLIWAGSDTGLIHLTRDGGKTWKDVTPIGLGEWSKISLLEASHFDPAEAYAAVDRHRLDDRTPYLYRTRDYGTSWQPITDGLQAPSFVRAVREDPQRRGLLFAGTEFGVYVSFDDGDHWQSLQLNLPVTSVHDLVLHGDDLVIATHGRSFWILDDITPLRQTGEVMKAGGGWLYRPATAVRIDNDTFLGTPLPPEEPTADNPPNGALLDFYLPQAAEHVKLDILDGRNDVIRSFSSDQHMTGKRPQFAVADRWLPPPQIPGVAAGMHRLVWDLAWNTSGAPEVDDFEVAPLRGPRVAPGTFQVRLTVDGKSLAQPLKVVMDPRSSATPEELQQQYELGRKMFAAAKQGRKALAEIMALQKQLAAVAPTVPKANADLQSSVTQLQEEIRNILKGSGEPSGDSIGLEQAATGLAGALRVVESSDRAVPSQAIEVFQESNRVLKVRLEEWIRLKSTRVPQLNDQLKQANMAPLTIAETEPDDDSLSQ
ncbi:MAG: hypothetical protein WB952_21225 [Terriglobales bacterium]